MTEEYSVPQRFRSRSELILRAQRVQIRSAPNSKQAPRQAPHDEFARNHRSYRHIKQGLKIAGRLYDSFCNMLQVVLKALGMLHRGRACCNTWSRNFGGNPFRVRTDIGTPSNFSASIFKPAIVSRLVDSPGSTSKSRSHAILN